MMTNKRFRMLGYIYAIIGAFLTFVDGVDKIYYNVNANSHQGIYYISPMISFVLQIFFIILLGGIWKNNPTLVKIYRVSLHVTYGLVIGCLIVGIVVGIMYKLLTDDDVPFGLIKELIIALVVFIGLYLFFLWITNGVLEAIQYKQDTSNIVLYLPETKNKEEI